MNSSASSISPSDGYGHYNRTPSISEPAPSISVHKPSPYDFDAEDRNKRKRLVIFAVLAGLLLLAFLVPFIVNLASRLSVKEQKEEGDLSDSVIVDKDQSWRDYDSNDNQLDDGSDDKQVTYGCTTDAVPDPKTDFITRTLPNCASTLELALPASTDDIFYDNSTGITGYGVHAAEFPEGLDHAIIALRPGTPVKSWARGNVVDISQNDEYVDIRIDYGRNLVGIHIGIETPYVKKGDRVLMGQEIGVGRTLNSGATSAEFALLDKGRSDGVSAERGSYVSPFDYLEDDEKEKITSAYKKHVLDPYRSGGASAVNSYFYPREPYLTNRLFLHNGNEGKLAGEWYLKQKWREGSPADVISFIEAENSYFSGNYLIASDYRWKDNEYEKVAEGSFVVDYAARTLRISKWEESARYCKFELDDSKERAVLMLECKTGSYPTAFSASMLEYVERDAVPLIEDAEALGVQPK